MPIEDTTGDWVDGLLGVIFIGGLFATAVGLVGLVVTIIVEFG